MKIRNRPKKAIALTYQPRLDNAPRITAKGKGEVAEKIIQIAKENNIYTHNDSDLVEMLSHLDLNEEIPPNLYIIVAELLAFVYSLNSGQKLR